MIAARIVAAAGAGRASASARLAAWRAHFAPAALASRLAACVATEVERRRLLPWGAVLFGVGILLFFGADAPSLAAALAATIGMCVAAALAARRSHALGIALAGLAFVGAGFTAGAVRQASVAAPALAAPAAGDVIGVVESLDARPGATRAVLRILEHDLPVVGAPGVLRARVGIRDARDLAPGDRVRAVVRLLPPPEAVRPGGYDFAKEAYFRGIGAVGSVSGRVSPAPASEPPGLALAFAARLDAWRNAVTARIAERIGGQSGAVAAALVTGKRGLIAEETNDALRAAGVYHIVSISGLHMVLAAGTVFFGLRALMAAVPALALTKPVKKIAAAAAILAGAAYCVFSGSAVATERALVMTTIVFGAILVDRPALSMRNLAFAALIVLATAPEALVGPSFQMSFSAVAGLIAGAEWQARRVREPGPTPGRIARAWRVARAVVLGIVGTTLIATVATGPFAAYHFQLANPYGVLGNVLALPVVTFLVMPAAVVGMLALPFGLDGPAWSVMGAGVTQVIAFSEAVASLPGSQVVVPAFGTGALACLVAALLVATLCVSQLRWLSLAPAALGLVLAMNPDRADLYVDRDGRGAALRGADGRLVVVGDPGAFVLAQWLRADGDARAPDDPSLAAGVACDALACVAPLHDRAGVFAGMVSHVRDARAFSEDCIRARVVVSRLSIPAACAARLAVGRAERTRLGAHTARVEGDAIVVETVRRDPETRAWLVRGE